MSNINIAGLVAVDDPSYRYKMPKVQAKIEGRGNGIKTVLVNIVELAGALKREAPEVTKFFGCELGAQTIYTLETGYERAIVNGAHSEMDLQKSLSRYIEFFVLCKSCRLPETYYKIKSGIVSQNCLACGCKFDCDLNHKLTTFILAQHKKAKELKAKTEKADKKEKGDKNVLDDDKEKKDKKEKKKDKDKDKEKSEKVGGEEKADKKKKKKKELVEGGAGEGDGGDETEAMAAEGAIDKFKQWIVDNPDAALARKLEELRNLQTIFALRPADRPIIFLGSVFTEKFVKDEEVLAHKDVLVAIASTPIQQRHLLAAAEWLCGTRFPSLLKFFPVLLKQLYDADIVEEDAFFEWDTDSIRNDFTAHETLISDETLETLRGHAKQFITWLQEAEEEGEDGEDGEDDEEDEDEEEDDDEA